MSSPFESLLSHFDLEEGKRQIDGSWMLRCPGPNHLNGDRDPSLHVSEGQDGRVLLKCMSGDCAIEDILRALDLKMADLFPSERFYDYPDEDGHLVYQVVRRYPKGFRQRRPDPNRPGHWIYNMKGVRRVLYRLPQVLAAVKTGERLWIVEGEKDADALANLGLTATTSPMGAGKWRSEYSKSLEGARVVVLPDNDEAGREHARDVVKSLLPMAAEVRILELPVAEKGDVSDWLLSGGTADELKELADAAPLVTEIPAARSKRKLGIRLSDVQPEKVEWLWPGHIPLGKLTIIDGDPSLGKSNLSLDIAARVTTGRDMPDGQAGLEIPYGVVILAGEDGLADTIRPRFDAAGGDARRVLSLTLVPDTPTDDRLASLPEDLHFLEEAVGDVNAKLVIVDPLMAFLSDDIDTHKDQSTRSALSRLALFASKTGAAVLLIRHLTKTAGVSAMYRGMGSIAITAAVRSAFIVGRHPSDPELRVLAPIKNNLAKLPPSLCFRLESTAGDVPRVAWGGSVELSADDLGTQREAPRDATDKDFVKDYLLDLLGDEPKHSKELYDLAAEQGISKDRARRALHEIRARPVKHGKEGGWFWHPPNFVNSDIEFEQ